MMYSIFALVIALTLGLWGSDTTSGEVSSKEVTAVFVRESDHINYLTIADEYGRLQIIETTDSHPFWVVTDEPDLERAARSVVDENGVWLYHENVGPMEHGYWVEAKDLREGDVFIGANGELSTFVSIERVVFPDGIKVYNFTVDGNHDYFVIAQVGDSSTSCILVHNANGSYTITFNNGMKYHGKGGPQRALDSAKRIEKNNPGVKREHIDWTDAPDTATSFRDEAKRIANDGGIGKGIERNYNIKNSPGMINLGNKGQ